MEHTQCTQLIDLLEKEYPHAKEIKAVEGLKILLGIDPSSMKQTTITRAEIDRLKLNQTSKAFILLKNATVHYFQDQFGEAIQSINLSNQLNEEDQNPFLTYFNFTLLAQLYEEMGELSKALALLRKIKDWIRLFQFSPSMQKNYFINFYITITGIYLKQFKMEKAANTLKKASNQESEHLQAAYLYNQAEFLYLSNQPESAFKIVQQFEHEMSNYANSLVKSGLIKYCLKNNQLSKQYQDSFINSYHENPSFQNMNNQLFYSLILLKQQDYRAALTMVDHLLINSRRNKLLLKTVEGTLLKITILLEMNSSDERLIKNLYGESLYYACENTIKAPFYLYKETLVTLHHSYGTHLIEKLDPKEQQFHKEVLLICCDDSGTMLTAREKEVLMEIANGATNKEMAQSLFISEATVKTHILNIYRKLEVNSRITVVEKARELNLL